MFSGKKLTKTAAVVLSAALAGLFGTAKYYSAQLPEVFTAQSAEELRIAEYPELSFGGAVPASGGQATVSLFGAIPVKTVSVREAEAPVLIVSGEPFGIKLLMDGVMVTELGNVTDRSGAQVCPAAEAGIEVGDVIKRVDGVSLTSNSELQSAINAKGGAPVELTVSRGGHDITTELVPVYSSASNSWKGGMWVRDSAAGIGTITFINKDTGEFAGLGHPICDSDTGELVPICSGEAVPVEIERAKRGERGIPGELTGSFSYGGSYGVLNRNTACGVYGLLTADALAELSSSGTEMVMAYRQEVETGAAEIISTVADGTPKRYSIEIESIDLSDPGDMRDMVIHITDPDLIEASGGIVQGMSGSPVIQNGRLVGAVTHVFVADPTRGYAVFAETMAEELTAGG